MDRNRELQSLLPINLEIANLLRKMTARPCRAADWLRGDAGVDRQMVKSPVAWHSDHIQVGKRHVQMFSLKMTPESSRPCLVSGPSTLDCDSIHCSTWRVKSTSSARSEIDAQEKFISFFKVALPAIYTTEEIRAILQAADPYMRIVIEMGLKFGLREQELMYAEWTDLDWEQSAFRAQGKKCWDFRVKDSEQREIPCASESVEGVEGMEKEASELPPDRWDSRRQPRYPSLALPQAIGQKRGAELREM
jgi:hypothetical protein